MSVFVIVAQEQNPELEKAIIAEFPNDHFKLGGNQWLVSATGTAKEVSTKIGISEEGKKLEGIVFTISGYWGRATNDTWEWIVSRWEKKNG